MLRQPRGGDPLLTEWAAILNSIILRREPEILGVSDNGTNWNVRYRAPYSCGWIQEHLQSSVIGEGGSTYDSVNYTSTTLTNCRTERMQDVAVPLVAGVTYTLFLIPVQYDGAGTKIIYDGVTAEDRMVMVSQAMTNAVFPGAIYVDHINEATAAHGVVIDGVTLKDGGGTFTNRVQVTGSDSPTSGIGLELFRITSPADGARIQAYNRDTPAYITMQFRALDFSWHPNGTQRLDLSATALNPTLTGGLTLGTAILPWGAAWMGALSATTGTFSGQVTLTGSGRVWVCVDLEPSRVKLPGANPPAEDVKDAFPFHRYNRATEESVYFVWTIPHDFASGDASLRGHFSFLVENPPVAPAGDEAVVMGFEYKKISPDAVFDFGSGTASGTITEAIETDETAEIVHITSEGTCVTTGWAPHDKILFRFYRDATNVADTYDNEAAADDNDVWVEGYHLEYLADKLGEAS